MWSGHALCLQYASHFRLCTPQLTRPQSAKRGPLDILRQSLRDEGPRFLFKGWTPAFIRLGPNTVLMFVFYEVRARASLLRQFH